MRTTMGRVAGWSGVVFFLLFGAWALVAPRSFFDVVAPWRPYNEHLFHDSGAFSVGLGVGLLVATGARAGLATLAGAATGAILHALSHVIDYGDGGRATDPYLLGGLALVLLAGLVAEYRAGT